MWVSLSNNLLLPPTCGFPHELQYFELVPTMVFLIYNIEQEQTIVITVGGKLFWSMQISGVKNLLLIG